jgi:hypothetical protein
MAIHFWNTKALARKLAHDGISERDAYGYYLANSIMWTILNYYAIATGARIGWLFFYEILVVLVVTVFGLSRCYAANGGHTGQHFVLRATCLSFPISLKISTASILLIWVNYVVFPKVVDSTTFRDPGHVWDLVTFVWAPVFTALFFWRLWHHLSFLQNLSAPNPKLNRTRADDARAG